MERSSDFSFGLETIEKNHGWVFAPQTEYPSNLNSIPDGAEAAVLTIFSIISSGTAVVEKSRTDLRLAIRYGRFLV